uniref:Uncharacterized protein n=1 Tax=Avena sativa TaxID=4498 RepID=A0ACD5YIW9_AVESA
MATAGAAVDRLLRRLASDAPRLELPSNMDEDVAYVRRTLSRLQDAVVSVERQYFKMRSEAQDWMRKIKHIASEMEDLLDEFEDRDEMASETSGCVAKVTPFCSSSPFVFLKTRGHRLRLIRRKLDLSAKDSILFNLMQHATSDVQQFDKQEMFNGATVVGRDNDRSTIKSLLLQNGIEGFSIIPLVGLIGSGKTTLARLIFDDQEEGWNFDLRIWVQLGRNLDLREVATDLISQANKTEKTMRQQVDMKNPTQDLQSMKNHLQDILCERSCLLVLDDLYSTNKNQLSELKEMLRSTKSTKIIVTTCSETTAELMHTVPPYKLGPLSEDDCWTIFSGRAFSNENGFNSRLTEIGKQIVKRCKGIPSVAHYLGSIVHNKGENVWLLARDEEIWKLGKRFPTKVDLFSSFKHTYHNMSSVSKSCFVYLSVLSKASAIDMEKLVRQLVALDMLGSNHKTLPDYVLGEMCIQELLSISFLEVTGTSSATCTSHTAYPMLLRVHSLVHDFAKYVAHDDLITLDGRVIPTGLTYDMTFRYGVVTNDTALLVASKGLLNNARALSFKNCKASGLLGDAFSILNHLRVLDLSRCCIVELPACTGHFKHLRYLDVSDLMVEKLPNQMSSLLNLEALDLSKSCLEMLPSFVGKFQKLKYLNLHGCENLKDLPSTLGELQKLEHLNLSCCYKLVNLPESLLKLQELRYLDLSNWTELQQLPHLFGALRSLEYLNLSSCYRLRQLPESLGELYFLQFLNLSSCYELQQLPQSLTDLVNLEVLRLSGCSRLEHLPVSFSNIKGLRILDLACCEKLLVNTETLTSNLEHLKLYGCQRLLTKPGYFGNFPKLKYLDLTQCFPIKNCLESLGSLLNLEYLNISHISLELSEALTKLKRLHTLDITGCGLSKSSNMTLILPGILQRMSSLKFLLTDESWIALSVPQYIHCSVGTDKYFYETDDELVINNLWGSQGSLQIAARANLQDRTKLRFLKLKWATILQSNEDNNIYEAIEKLQPHHSLSHLELFGYNGSSFPCWISNVQNHPLNLVSLRLCHLKNCEMLPPLGHLPKLRHLYVEDMPKINNVTMDLRGLQQPLRELTSLHLQSLQNMEQWWIVSTNGEGEFMFPVLRELSVESCPKLLFKPSIPKCAKYSIKNSDMILSSEEPLGPSSSPAPLIVEISNCTVPCSTLVWLQSLGTLQEMKIYGKMEDFSPNQTNQQPHSFSYTPKEDDSSTDKIDYSSELPEISTHLVDKESTPKDGQQISTLSSQDESQMSSFPELTAGIPSLSSYIQGMLLYREMLVEPIKLADLVANKAGNATWFRMECSELKNLAERLSVLLDQAAQMELYERPARRIIASIVQGLDKASALAAQCHHGQYSLRRVFTRNLATIFRSTIASLHTACEDIKWLIRISSPHTDSDQYEEEMFGLPNIAEREPILFLIWVYIAQLHSGNLTRRADSAAHLACLAQDNLHFGKLIIEEDGVAPLLKLLNEGNEAGKEAAALALGLLGRDEETADTLILKGVLIGFKTALQDPSIRVRNTVTEAIKLLIPQYNPGSDLETEPGRSSYKAGTLGVGDDGLKYTDLEKSGCLSNIIT